MANATWLPIAQVPARTIPRHSALVRVTHWITTICFIALLLTGIEILISHPRFYWGEVGNSLTPPLFTIPIPASRASVPTGYGYVLPDQNGWSRYLHFQAAWLAILTGVLYVASSVLSRHLRTDLLPNKTTASGPYGLPQRLTYLAVIFVLFPLVIWTGLAMSPAVASAFPPVVTMFGGQQSARTLHFAVSLLLLLFVIVHLVMVYRSGFVNSVRAMITGRANRRTEAAHE